MKKFIVFCENYAPELLVVLVCVPAMIRLIDVNSYHTMFYFVDYSTGFGGRKLLGTICNLWFPEVVDRNYMLPVIICVNTLMIGLFAWFIGKCVRQAKENQFALLVFIALYLLSPFSFKGFIRGAIIDFYICTATLCFIFLFLECRGKWYYYILTFLILCVACLTHQIFCNIFFPLVFSLFIYDIFSNENNRNMNITIYSLISLGLFVLFCTIMFKGTMNVDFRTYYDYLQTRAGRHIDLSNEKALYYNMYASLPEHIQAYLIPAWKYDIARFSLTLIIFAPLWGMLWTPWIMAIKNAVSKSEIWCYILMQLSIHIMILPAYVIAVDYERWTFAYCFCQICMLLILYSSGYGSIKVQISKLFNYAKQYKSVSLVMAAYICTFGLVQSFTAAPIVDFICSLLGLSWTSNSIVPY